MYSIIEFKEEAEGGGLLSIINTGWLTPRKSEVYWPPIKDNNQFNKVLRKIIDPEINDKWRLYGVQKIFYSTDDYEKATRKLKRAELTSDLQTDAEEDQDIRPKRRIFKRKISSDEDDDNENSFVRKSGNKSKSLPRPPPVKIINTSTSARVSSQELETYTDKSDIGECSDSQKQNKTYTPRSNDLPSIHISTPKVSSFASSSSKGTASVTTHLNDDESLNSDSLQDKNVLQFLLKNVLKVREQNKQILEILKESSDIPKKNSDLPEDVKVKLPVDSLEHLDQLEIYLTQEENFNSFKLYCNSISNSKEVTQKNNRILRTLLTDGVAKHFNYFGNNRHMKESEKRAFNQLRLHKVVLNAVKQGNNFTTEEVENAIKRWLKHAPNRNKKNE